MTVWAFEDVLSSQRRGLHIGDDLQTSLERAGTDLRALLASGGVSAEWVADLDPAASASRTRQIRGRVERIEAVTTRYREQAGRWIPAPGSARTHQVESTSAPDPARSVWPLSGSPVLIGFLLTLSDQSPAG